MCCYRSYFLLTSVASIAYRCHLFERDSFRWTLCIGVPGRSEVTAMVMPQGAAEPPPVDLMIPPTSRCTARCGDR
jgi:hypothetical protein